jgi:Zinc dependent phospholipase C
MRAPRASSLLRSAFLLVLFFTTTAAIPYSVQTHQELVDLAWKDSIEPILLKHYPGLTPEQLQVAHAYAYGGCAIQDFGYYPFGNPFFSELTHYVRSGDFVLSLLRNARTANELAFAIGALSHYIGDTIGHSLAVNHSVPVEFPNLARKYGADVNYAEDPHAHVQTEFAFDINQLSKGHFAPSAYLSHIGLEVPGPLLRTAFYETYGLNLTDLVGSKQTTLRVYRSGVRSFIPNIARAETILHKNSFPAETPGDDLDHLTAELTQISTDEDWQAYRRHPGFASHMYAGFIFILPKVGPLRMLAIKGPTTQTEALYIHSMSRSVRALRLTLTNIDSIDRYIANRDLDTGATIKPGGYVLADKTYAMLLARLTEHPTRPIPMQLKHDVLDYYADPDAPISTRNDPRQWATVQANLKILQTIPTSGTLNLATDRSFDDNGS